MYIHKSDFYPIESLVNKENYKRIFRIEKNWDIIERICLNIDDQRCREEIIARHYIINYQSLFLKELKEIFIINRDEPWDFQIKLDNDEIFNIEITSISDNDTLFRIMKDQERFNSIAWKQQIPLYELKKVNERFDNNFVDYDDSVWKHDIINNPYYTESNDPNCFIYTLSDEIINLSDNIKNTINNKIKKKHIDKDNTVLIIDNRTSLCNKNTFQIVLEELDSYFSNIPFKELWFYIWYYSDIDCKDYEFALIPLKLSDEQWKKIWK